mgnify:CR=1 FL=1
MKNKEKPSAISGKEKAEIMKMVNELKKVLEGKSTSTLVLEYALGIFVAHNIKIMTDSLHLNGQEIKFFYQIFGIAKGTLEVDGVDIDAQANDLENGETIELRNMN